MNSFPTPIPDLIVDDTTQEEEEEGNGRRGWSMGGVRRRLSVEFSQPEDYDTISVRQDSDIFLSLSQNYSTGQNNYHKTSPSSFTKSRPH